MAKPVRNSGSRAILSGVQGLKALIHLTGFAARLKSCPDYKARHS
jgi:hypothetical protein